MILSNFDAETIRDPKQQPEERLKVFLQRQTEYYFSDQNLSKDRYLREQICKSSRGYVRLSLLLRFNRLRKAFVDFKVDYKKQMSSLSSAIKGSSFLQLNKLNTMVRRNTSMPFNTETLKAYLGSADKRSIYVENAKGD